MLRRTAGGGGGGKAIVALRVVLETKVLERAAAAEEKIKTA